MVPVLMDGKVHFNSIYDASRALLRSWGMAENEKQLKNVSSTISAVIHGRYKTGYGHTFEIDSRISRVWLVSTPNGVCRVFSSKEKAGEYIASRDLKFQHYASVHEMTVDGEAS